MRIGIIADDLTGANDCGVQFVKCNFSVKVFVDIPWKGLENLVSGEIVAVNTNTRALLPQEAYERVKKLSRALAGLGNVKIYKKIDSTLRGNVGAEIDAILDVFRFPLALVAPAFPDMGRITVGGRQLVEGVPIDETEIAFDLVTPVKKSHIPTLIKEQMSKRVIYIPLSVVEKGVQCLKEKLLRVLYEKGQSVVVLDASENLHLKTIARVVLLLENEHQFSFLLVGSAGLASAIAQVISPEIPERKAKNVMLSEESFGYDKTGVLMVSGSAHPRTLLQIEKLTLLDQSTRVFRIKLGYFLVPEKAQSEIHKVVEEACLLLSRGYNVVLTLEDANIGKTNERRGRRFLIDDKISDQASKHNFAWMLVRSLAEVSKQILEKTFVKVLVLMGGDTTLAVCRALECECIDLVSEISPGVVLGRIVDGPYKGMKIITKAGGFGDDDLLFKILRSLTKEV
ncbi:MAG: D-threonate/D-erythronate kinase [Candidatus Atribacteria bacterium]|nr:D-threonate/D-erythronate kinase [Candidatus Atribacteria bacterium]